jgi:hypothetical protein
MLQTSARPASHDRASVIPRAGGWAPGAVLLGFDPQRRGMPYRTNSGGGTRNA